MLLPIVLLATAANFVFAQTECQQCVALVSDPNELHSHAAEEMLQCHITKVRKDQSTKSRTPIQSCADIGICPEKDAFPYPFNSTVDIRSITHSYQSNGCYSPSIVLLHHTVDATVGDAIAAMTRTGLSVQYIVARNGTVYRMVDDYYRAWHAGGGSWRQIQDMNSNSIGIEIVNRGDEPFDAPQVASVIKLVGYLKEKWHIQDHNLVAHGDSQPWDKMDPSGFFPWHHLYSQLAVYKNVFDTKLTKEEQKKVVLDHTSTNKEMISKLQKRLYAYGYTARTMQDGVYDDNTQLLVQSFNRHYSKEVFKPEGINGGQIVYRPENRQWYALSDERLNHLLSSSATEY